MDIKTGLSKIISSIRHHSEKVLDTVLAEVTARLSYRFILNRPIDRGALERWKDLLGQNRLYRAYLINSLFLSEEYGQLIRAHPFVDLIMLNYLHQERCRLVRGLPGGELLVDLGGSSPGNPRGALLSMGYSRPFKRLLIVDLPLNQSLEQSSAKETYDVVDTELGQIRYIYRHMCELGEIGLDENSVDLFWMGQSVEHIEEDEFDLLLSAIYRYLKPGGHFCFDTPNRRVTRLQAPDCFIHPDHKIEYFCDDLRKKLTSKGFHVIETRGIGLSDESLTNNRFLGGYAIENACINQDPEQSYIFYFKAQKRL